MLGISGKCILKKTYQPWIDFDIYIYDRYCLFQHVDVSTTNLIALNTPLTLKCVYIVDQFHWL